MIELYSEDYTTKYLIGSPACTLAIFRKMAREITRLHRIEKAARWYVECVELSHIPYSNNYNARTEISLNRAAAWIDFKQALKEFKKISP